MQRRPIRCALFTAFRHDWASAIILACPGLECLALSPSAIGLAEAPNPFALPLDDRADVVLLTRNGYDWLAAHHSQRAEQILGVLEARAEAVIGLDDGDDFELGFPPEALERVAALIKPQGVYRDRDLYNYRVGPVHPGAVWTKKVRPRRPAYPSRDLEKVKLSVPCFVTDIPVLRRHARRRETDVTRTSSRDMSRPERLARDAAEAVIGRALSLAPTKRRPLEVHCVTGLSHVQRIEAMRLLDGFSGERGITETATPQHIAGTEYGFALPDEERRRLVSAAAPYMTNRVGRLRYLLDLSRHQVIVAPTGYGELGNRHSDAWRARAALVCQDLSHVEMMFPLTDGENVSFCQPDLSDLRQVVQRLLAAESFREHIARTGHRRFAAWSARWRDHLYNGIELHLLTALGRVESAPITSPGYGLSGQPPLRRSV